MDTLFPHTLIYRVFLAHERGQWRAIAGTVITGAQNRGRKVVRGHYFHLPTLFYNGLLINHTHSLLQHDRPLGVIEIQNLAVFSNRTVLSGSCKIPPWVLTSRIFATLIKNSFSTFKMSEMTGSYDDSQGTLKTRTSITLEGRYFLCVSLEMTADCIVTTKKNEKSILFNPF